MMGTFLRVVGILLRLLTRFLLCPHDNAAAVVELIHRADDVAYDCAKHGRKDISLGIYPVLNNMERGRG